MRKSFLACLALILLAAAVVPVKAQENQPAQPYYVVQERDSLWDIAVRFGVGIEELQKANGISDPAQLSIGVELVIPGLDGYQGRLDTTIIPFGETLRSLSRRYLVPVETLVSLNRVASPAQLFAGATLIIPYESTKSRAGPRTILAPSQSLLELAVMRNSNPWTLIENNYLPGTWAALPGETLRLAGTGADGPGALPEVITAVLLNPLPFIQGKTALIKISSQPGLALSGSLAGRELRFFELEDGYVALQGTHAMTEPGLYPLTLAGKLSRGEFSNEPEFVFSQPVYIRGGDYAYDPVLSVDPETLDPSVTGPENEIWSALGAPVTSEKMWNGKFQSPVPEEFTRCWTSPFGNRRSYNGGAYNSFHSGLDFCGGIGTELYAPAAGKVVFAGPLTVRGNATVIDHGWGVYTAYDHQSEILVKPGEVVKPGQIIGLGGATGRVTGPHLHWEVWVGGVPVDPVDWLEQAYP
jgi:murein DD-endopeptidase MepM/ murein hydrolase activator NlpD